MTKTSFLFSSVLSSVLLALNSSTATAQFSSDETILRVEPAFAQAVSETASRHVALDRAVAAPRRFVLDPVDNEQAVRALRAPAQTTDSNGIVAPRQQIGFSREVPALRRPSLARAQFDWQAQSDGGHAAAIAIASPDAVALRLGIRVFSLPREALIRVYAPGDTTATVFTGGEIVSLIALNLAAGELSEEAHEWWSPVVEGSETVLEILLPPGIETTTVDIALPRISHLFAGASTDWDAEGSIEKLRETSSCRHNAVRCYAEWDTVSRATAKMVFSDGGGSYLCTGTLLNDADPATDIPYLLTAQHCINTQSQASSLTTYWLYRATTCNGSKKEAELVRSGGAKLLYQTNNTDTAFLRLNEQPPAEAAYAGWQATLPAKGRALTGVHHPNGDLQKISFSTLQHYDECIVVDGESGCYMDVASSESNHFTVKWSSGTVEPGSSGSGIFDTSGKYLVGTLHGSASPLDCSDEDIYGRFDLPYKAKLHEYLNAVSATNRTLAVSLLGNGDGKVSGSNIDCGSTCSAQYSNNTSVTLTATPATGSSFVGWGGACSGTGATCTLTMSADREVTAGFNASPSPMPPGEMSLRDAIYLYNQPISGLAAQVKTLAAYNCDVFQILLDVESGFTDLTIREGATASGPRTTYSDRLYDTGAMFSYALYSSSPVKLFGLARYRDSGSSASIGTVTVFGYCFSTRTDAVVLMHDANTGLCHRPGDVTVSCPTIPDTLSQPLANEGEQ
ncbi:MAG: trypsin-like peptidase domain-containing protein [Azoarcus sp.]|jgi:hypothetical protein|nr:trypsin-like peptidase domain-containing protein [Azoarcus sp.]